MVFSFFFLFSFSFSKSCLPPGMQYHPHTKSNFRIRGDNLPPNKLKTCSSMTFPSIPLARICNSAFLLFLIRLAIYPAREHNSELLYNVIIPYLLDEKSLPESVALPDLSSISGSSSSSSALWSTPTRSVGGSAARTALSLFRFVFFQQIGGSMELYKTFQVFFFVESKGAICSQLMFIFFFSRLG